MKAHYYKYTLDFKRPGGTSRGVLTAKETWFLILEDKGMYGIGECALFKGLSTDDVSTYEDTLRWVCENIEKGETALYYLLNTYPSIQFGVEQAFLSLKSKTPFELFPSKFTDFKAAIQINGLIWMGEEKFMLSQIKTKIKQGFRCIKMKIGALNFDSELRMLRQIRKQYTSAEIQLRVDANGAFNTNNAIDKLKALADCELHSIEQPIKPGNYNEMKALCKITPLPIALDEELIGVWDVTEKEKLLQTVQPQFIILKPSLIGGFKGSLEWIRLAEKYKIGWWVTSALESNIGLNAIAQWTFTLENELPQGLGTGALFTNNFNSPLEVTAGHLQYNKMKNWNTNLIQNLCT